MLVKILAVLLVAGGLWIWVSGRSITAEDQAAVPSASPLAASVALAPAPAPVAGAFDKEGTIILDMSQGAPGTPFLLYTDYNEQGKPSIRTKRLVFLNQDSCAEQNLPCATSQPRAPVNADEKVRIRGTLKDESVVVSSVERLSS